MNSGFFNNVQKFTGIAYNVMLGGFLSLMATFLFINIFLRYFFNSGLPWAEEMARFLFVWITFIGAVGALKDNKHLGFTTVVKKFPMPLKKASFLFNNIMVLYILYLVFTGSIAMSKFGMRSVMAITRLPMAFMWAVGIISAGAMFVIIVANIYKGMFVPGELNKLLMVIESEDELELERIEAEREAKRKLEAEKAQRGAE